MRRNSKTEKGRATQSAEIACQLFHSRGLCYINTAFENNNLCCEPTGFERSVLVRSSITVETQARYISDNFQCLIETGITENFEHGES